jgi:uncharacterized membrane protein YGL010W
MKSINQWLSEYGESHQNPTNKMVHFVCVPVIFFTIVGLLYCIKLPFSLAAGYPMTVAHLTLLFVAVYYSLLSIPLAIGMVLYGIGCLLLCHAIDTAPYQLLIVSIVLFVLAWIAQFWGHNVEGKKPSFLKDIQYLMIGPAWIMSFLYKKIGLSV